MPVGLISSALLVLLRKPAFSSGLTLEFYRVIEKFKLFYFYFSLLLITLNPIFGNFLADVSDWRFGDAEGFLGPVPLKILTFLLCHGPALGSFLRLTREISHFNFIITSEESRPFPSESWYSFPPRNLCFHSLTIMGWFGSRLAVERSVKS